ncbi:hypothetical protein GCWU000324_01159 [Kingella oralis ATCC 51147]|uniref:Uncharacterized protein n=1 Tax=Kingella oralis ATCC 51147 TaxID=629741 RepID=C4GG92_9NEIS|nr:hypothetical protein GCWU000324_01159 [Kingella oralis ATCC 51147]
MIDAVGKRQPENDGMVVFRLPFCAKNVGERLVFYFQAAFHFRLKPLQNQVGRAFMPDVFSCGVLR